MTIELCISACTTLEGSEEEWGIATVFGDIPLIVFNKNPTFAFSFIERHIEEIIEHETLHIVISQLEGKSGWVDAIFPNATSLTNYKKKGGCS